MERRFRTKQSHLRFPTLDGKWFSDTSFPVPKSIRGNSAAQLTMNGKGYTHFYPMRAKSEAPDALMDFIHENGVPAWLVVDNAPEQNHGRWNKIQREFHNWQTNTEPYSPWQNRAEGEIRELKKMIKRLALRCNSPKRLWCFAGELAAAIGRLTATDHALLRGRSPQECVHGDTPDISEYCQLDWYDWVYWRDDNGEQHIGRWIGVAHKVGGPMVHWVLPESCKPIAKSTVYAIPLADFANTATIQDMTEFDGIVRKKIGNRRTDAEVDSDFEGVFPVNFSELFDDIIDDPTEPFTPNGDIHGDALTRKIWPMSLVTLSMNTWTLR
jgi:hypothetical protein